MIVTVTADVEKALKTFSRIRKDGKSSADAMAVATGKRAAYYGYQYTLPKNQRKAPPSYAKMASRISGNVKSAYGTKSDSDWGGKAYFLIKQAKGEKKAAKWLAQYKSNKWESENWEDTDTRDRTESPEGKFDKMRGIPRKMNEQEYLDYRKANGYKVPHSPKNPAYKVLGFVSEDKRQKLIKSRQGTMGLAKNSWRAAFESLRSGGGRSLKVGRGGKLAEDRFPKEGSAVYRRFGGISMGGAKSSRTNDGYKGRVDSNIRYMDFAFPPRLQLDATRVLERYMKMVMDLRIKHSIKGKTP